MPSPHNNAIKEYFTLIWLRLIENKKIEIQFFNIQHLKKPFDTSQKWVSD